VSTSVSFDIRGWLRLTFDFPACLPLGFNEQGEPLLKKVAPEDDAWNDLQLPGGDDGHKHIIQSLIKKHFAKDMAIDLVRDKGRGLIILLHGAP
jgi:hypothetical protein